MHVFLSCDAPMVLSWVRSFPFPFSGFGCFTAAAIRLYSTQPLQQPVWQAGRGHLRAHGGPHTHTHDPRPVGYVERALSIKTRDYFSELHRSLGTGRSLSRARSIHTKPLFYEPHRTLGAGRGLSRGASSLVRTQISCSTLSPHAPFPITRRLQSCHTSSRAAHRLDLARPRHPLPRHPLQSSSRG